MLLAAFALRLYRLGAASLWYDETVSVMLAQKDWLALTRHTAGDIHPPLYYYLLHLWGRLAGWSEFAVAFLSLVFGVLLVALVYRVAREWFNARVARLAALLVALSPYNLWYSQEVRMYTLGAFLGLASTYLFVRMLQRAPHSIHHDSRFTPHVSRFTPHTSQSPFYISRDFIAYVLVSALGLYTLYYFAFLLVFENLVALIWLFRNSQFAIRNFEFRIWIASQLAILALYAPWLPIAFRQATDPPVPPWRSFTALPNVLLESFAALAFGQSIEPMLVAPMLVIIAGVIAFAFRTDRLPLTADCHSPSHCPTVSPSHCSTVSLFHCPLFLLGYTLVPLLIIYALSLWKPLYHVRYIFTYSPAFYILLALGIARIANGELRIIKRALLFTFYFLLFTFSIVSAYNFWYSPRYAKDDLRGAVHYLTDHWRPGDAILINAGYTYPAFLYYSDLPMGWRGRLTQYASRNTQHAVVLQTGSIGGAPNLGWGNPESDFYATTADETRAALDRVFAAHPRVWMLRLYDTVVDPDGVVRDHLATRGRLFDDEGFAGESYARVQGYLTTRAPLTTLPNDVARRELWLGNRIVLLGFAPASTTQRAGAPLDVEVYWQAREPTNVDARLYIGLFAEDGAVVAASDEIPIGNALGTSRWAPGEILRQPIRLRVPQHLAPGEYTLRVALYNPLTNETLAPSSQEFVTENGQIVLTRVRVDK
jgi:mannosyltransferase